MVIGGSAQSRPPPPAKVPAEVSERIGPFYVYALIDPADNAIFYVGKGTGDRVSAHGRHAGLEAERGESAKLARIHAIHAAGREPLIDIIRHGLDEEEAFRIEAALIDCLPGLTNAIGGQQVADGRTPLEELLLRYGAAPLPGDVAVPALIIRLGTRYMPNRTELEPEVFREGHGWHPCMTDAELYDSVRAWWRIDLVRVRREGITHAVAVVGGVTRGVYRIDKWFGPNDEGRRGFSGERLTKGSVFEAYVGPLGRRVEFPRYSQSPVMYWPRPA